MCVFQRYYDWIMYSLYCYYYVDFLLSPQVVPTEGDGSSAAYGNGRIRLEEARMDKLVSIVMCLNYVVEAPIASGSSQVLVWAGTAVWMPCVSSAYEIENMRLDPDDDDSKTSRTNEVSFATGPKRWFGGASQSFVSSEPVGKFYFSNFGL